MTSPPIPEGRKPEAGSRKPAAGSWKQAAGSWTWKLSLGLTGLVLAVAASALACGSRPEPGTPPADPTELLLDSAAADFRAQRAPRPAGFRNVRSGYLATPGGGRQQRLCGEFLAAPVDGEADWVPFATVQTAPYEQWLGGQALPFCSDPAAKWDQGDLSSRLLERFTPDR